MDLRPLLNNRVLLIVAIALALLLAIGVILAGTGFGHGERATALATVSEPPAALACVHSAGYAPRTMTRWFARISQQNG